MDERLEKALNFSNFRMILSTKQENLKTLLQNKLLFHYEGYVFKIDQNLIGLLGALIVMDEKEFILIDKNDTPVLIKDIPQFFNSLMPQYKKSLESYYNNYQKLSEAREIRKVIDWEYEE
jgi:hypothetical protein